jgi:hypothetical protein
MSFAHSPAFSRVCQTTPGTAHGKLELFPRRASRAIQAQKKITNMANETGTNTTRTISRSEKTHAKNLENVHIANSIIANLGAVWNPKNPLITATALTEFEDTASGLMQAVNAAFSAEQAKVGAQMADFKLVSKRVNKIMKAAAAQGLSTEFMANLRSTSNRLNGVRVDKSTPDTPPAAAPPTGSNGSASVSRRSYAGILESLDLLDEQLKTNKNYDPNEPEYKSAAVSAWVEGLRTTHNAALDSKTDTRAARSARDAYLYNPTSGIIARMNAVKAYAETILDKSDPRFQQLKKLRFVDYSR